MGELTVMIMAGGTGGHVFPALATAARLRESGAQVFWLGTRRGMESRLVPEHGIEIEWIPIEGLRGTGIKRLLKAPFKLLIAMYQAARVIRRRRPDVALGMGGFASGPGGLMAWLLRVPLVVHEQNRVPGLTNQWLSRMAVRVFEAFPGSFDRSRRAQACGNPVRSEIRALPVPEERFADRGEALRILVLGGSQGARVLNQNLPEALSSLKAVSRFEVRHQTGVSDEETTRQAYADKDIQAEVSAFIGDMAGAYAWADLVIARAGALTLSELAAAGVGSVLVPFPHAVDDHQTRNAEWLIEAGAARLMPQAQLTPESLSALLAKLLKDRQGLLEMARAARAMALLDADKVVAQACREVAGK